MGTATAAVNAMYQVGKAGRAYGSFPYDVREEVTGSKVRVIANHAPILRRNMGNNMVLLTMILMDSLQFLASGQNCTTAAAWPKFVAIEKKPMSITYVARTLWVRILSISATRIRKK